MFGGSSTYRQQIVAPVQQNMEEREEMLAPRICHKDGQHQAMKQAELTKLDNEASFPQESDMLYTRCCCEACAINTAEMVPSDKTCASYGGCICYHDGGLTGCQSSDPYIQDTSVCNCVNPDINIMENSSKFCCCKYGCDFGQKVIKDKCAKPLIVCCGAKIF
mmetsp:Transcript_4661/g.7522  ORF Transcript_4661/g.7522 Transcript_4661/m.7522 type:complete len:163 (+) Transcript_4661:58-546(+)